MLLENIMTLREYLSSFEIIELYTISIDRWLKFLLFLLFQKRPYTLSEN
jgi:hypothetical protein